jgi:hypothetical protein
MEVSSSCSCLLKMQQSFISNYKHIAIYKIMLRFSNSPYMPTFFTYLNLCFISPKMVLPNRHLLLPSMILLPRLVFSQCQSDSTYFDFSNALDIVSHALALQKFNNY